MIKKETIILGIDPGLANTGYGVIKDGSSLELLDYGCIETSKNSSHDDRLNHIYNAVIELSKKYKPSLISLEDLFFYKNVKSALKVGEAKGVVILAAKHSNVPFVQFTPSQVKIAVSGYGKASKEQVQKMVKSILKLKVIPKPDHASDALAVAICGINCN